VISYSTLLVLATTTLLGAIAGVLGSFAVLRGRALVGDLLAHAALPGLCVGFLLVGRRELGAMLLGAVIAGVAAVTLMTFIARNRRTKEDAALGIVLSVFFAAGIVLLSVIQNLPTGGAKAGMEAYLYGQAAGINRTDLLVIATIAALALLVLLLFRKEFQLVTFDPEFARVQGWPVMALDLGILGLITLVTMAGLPAVGVILMAALLVIPPAAARFWTDRIGRMLLTAAIVGGGSGILGTLISAGILPIRWPGEESVASELPTGPTIILCGSAIFLLSVLFAPHRGLAAKAIQLAILRTRIAADHLLRTLYELGEQDGALDQGRSWQAIRRARRWSGAELIIAAFWARIQGWISFSGNLPRLTPQGIQQAETLVRSHRLWELYLIDRAGIAPDHVDRDADAVEHWLTGELVSALEVPLREKGEVLKAPGEVPQSPHPTMAEERKPEGGDA